MMPDMPAPTAQPEPVGDVLLGVNPATLRITMANDAAAALLGYTPQQLLDMTITQVESSLQSVFYWEEVSAGHGHPLAEQEDLYRCADGRLVAVTNPPICYTRQSKLCIWCMRQRHLRLKTSKVSWTRRCPNCVPRWSPPATAFWCSTGMAASAA